MFISIPLLSNGSQRPPKIFSKLRYAGVSQPRATHQRGGSFCLVATTYGRLLREEIEAARKTIRRRTKKKGVLLVRAYPSLSYTKKPLQARMGKGKGRIEGTFCFVRPGQILMELLGGQPQRSLEALRSGSHKLSLATAVGPFDELFG
jgi:large subunit ribosomal protein L16